MLNRVLSQSTSFEVSDAEKAQKVLIFINTHHLFISGSSSTLCLKSWLVFWPILFVVWFLRKIFLLWYFPFFCLFASGGEEGSCRCHEEHENNRITVERNQISFGRSTLLYWYYGCNYIETLVPICIFLCFSLFIRLDSCWEREIQSCHDLCFHSRTYQSGMKWSNQMMNSSPLLLMLLERPFSTWIPRRTRINSEFKVVCSNKTQSYNI